MCWGSEAGGRGETGERGGGEQKTKLEKKKTGSIAVNCLDPNLLLRVAAQDLYEGSRLTRFVTRVPGTMQTSTSLIAKLLCESPFNCRDWL